MKNNFWNIVGIILLIFLAIILLNNFAGVIEKSDILNFYSNLLVVIITVTLGVITYEQTKHIQEESSKETENLRRLNKEANETNKKLVDIIERNTELEEQRNMPCVAIDNRKGEHIKYDENEINIEFRNIGTTIIKYIDIEEIPEKIIIQGLSNTVGESIKRALEILTNTLSKCWVEHTEKTDFLKFFNHNVDMIRIDEKFRISIKPRNVKNENGEDVYIVALNMKIENIYGKRYNEKVIILLRKDKEDISMRDTFVIEGKYVNIEIEK